MLARLLHRGNKARNKETFTKAWFLLVLVLLCQIIFNFFSYLIRVQSWKSHKPRGLQLCLYCKSTAGAQMQAQQHAGARNSTLLYNTEAQKKKQQPPRTYLESSSSYSTIQHSRYWWGQMCFWWPPNQRAVQRGASKLPDPAVLLLLALTPLICCYLCLPSLQDFCK